MLSHFNLVSGAASFFPFSLFIFFFFIAHASCMIGKSNSLAIASLLRLLSLLDNYLIICSLSFRFTWCFRTWKMIFSPFRRRNFINSIFANVSSSSIYFGWFFLSNSKDRLSQFRRNKIRAVSQRRSSLSFLFFSFSWLVAFTIQTIILSKRQSSTFATTEFHCFPSWNRKPTVIQSSVEKYSR